MKKKKNRKWLLALFVSIFIMIGCVSPLHAFVVSTDFEKNSSSYNDGFEVSQSLQPPGLFGPRYHANIKIKFGNDVLPPGPGETSTKCPVDTGSPATFINRSVAKALGLLNATGHDTGYAEGTATITWGRPIKVYYSKNCTILAQGKYCNCSSKDDSYTPIDNKKIIYPFPGQPDIPVCLLGTNYLNQLKNSFTGGKKDDVCFISFATTSIGTEGQQSETTPEDEDNAPAGEKRKKIKQIIIEEYPYYMYTDFFVGTGSPCTIIGKVYAELLEPEVVGEYDMYNEDRKLFSILSYDGFFEETNPGPIPIVELDKIIIPTIYDNEIVFSDVKCLVNHFNNKSVIGTNLLLVDILTTTKFDFGQNIIAFSVPYTFPSLEITTPKQGYLYIFDREIIPLPFEIPIILGDITVEAVAYEETYGIKKVEFYIDDELKATDYEELYEWLWDETVFFIHTIKVIVYNHVEKTATGERNVIIFNI